MNKTLSVNIGGIVFHIEEHAYDRLTKYLDSIKGYFTTSDGRDEIMQDIEARLGEMFQERISVGKQVIEESDVEHVINVMGKPEQFVDAAEEGDTDSSRSQSERRSYRRLYRDADDRVVGGVCAGFGHYLGIDPIWIRLAFAISFFVFGSGFLLYLILMVIMPKAVTTAEKLEMKGEKVNISNIKKSVEEEMVAIKSNFEGSRTRNSISSFFDALGQLLSGFFRILGKIIAGFFILIGFIILGSFVMTLLALIGVGSITIPFFMSEMVLEPWHQSFALVGGFLLIGVPVIMIIYTAVRVLFNVKSNNRAINWTAFALWIVGLGICLTVGSSIASNFKTRATSRTTLNIQQPESDTLMLSAVKDKEDRYNWYLHEDDDLHFPLSINDEKDTLLIQNVRLDIVKAEGTEFELTKLISARGSDRKDAYDNAEKVEYNITQTGNSIEFNEAYMIPKGVKFRGQKVRLILKVPVGKSVYLSPDMDDIIYDIENVTNTYDGYMVDHTWTMTKDGLECIGCNLPDMRSKKRDEFHIRINDKGVKVEGIDSDTDSTLNIEGDDVNIKINENGVEIKTRDKK